ncbi:hypothetical protein F4779DRAFT_125990 [Xylariaceae sp. FL0662B]|nr:hypothetical protein F4779DRAFT_125990 [Xylariaceae sp. FL0662B]
MATCEPLFDCNLPEMLVVDLEQSSDVFKSRHLTAGAPSPALADDGSRRRYSLQDSSLRPPVISAHQADVVSRTRSLQTIDQKHSQYITVGYKVQQRNNDLDTSSSESSAGGLEPPSIATREATITTPATSVSSKTESPFLSNSGASTDKFAGGSWMDLDMEEAAFTERRCSSLVLNPSPLHHHLTRRDDAGDLRSLSLNSGVPRPKLISPPTSPPPTTTNTTATDEQRNSVSPTPTVPERRSSLRHKQYPVLPQINVSPLLPASSSSRSLPQESSNLRSSPAPLETPRSEGVVNENYRTSTPSTESPAATLRTEQTTHMAGPMSPSIVPPQVDVESWLESSVESYAYNAHPRGDMLHTPAPLPPEVIDTLRVSVSCFPETMLLCSSLSIETIRNLSRRLRHRTESLTNESQQTLGPSEQSKQSKWKWNLFQKQPSTPTEGPSSPQRNNFADTLTSRYNPSWKPDWSAIQNLFPGGTDYLCDALYAHIVAYNYITSLCPRSALINPISRPASKSSSSKTPSDPDLRLSVELRASISDSVMIPHKAASLLGLQDDPNAPIPEPPSTRTNTLRSKRSVFALPKPPEGSRPRTAAAPGSGGHRKAPSDPGEHMLKDLRLGLARCIVRLVATLRLANSGQLPSSASTVDGIAPARREEDPDFMRALCEIVRVCEER